MKHTIGVFLRWFLVGVLLVVVLVQVLINMAAPLQLKPGENRFYGSDQSALGTYQNGWVLHDRFHPRQCLLVVEITSENGTPQGGPRAVTSSPWKCQ